MADEIFSSIGLYAMTDTFWNKSIIERPSDGRSLDCHGSAHDMVIDDDYRYEFTIALLSIFGISCYKNARLIKVIITYITQYFFQLKL